MLSIRRAQVFGNLPVHQVVEYFRLQKFKTLESSSRSWKNSKEILKKLKLGNI